MGLDCNAVHLIRLSKIVSDWIGLDWISRDRKMKMQIDFVMIVWNRNADPRSFGTPPHHGAGGGGLPGRRDQSQAGASGRASGSNPPPTPSGVWL